MTFRDSLVAQLGRTRQKNKRAELEALLNPPPCPAPLLYIFHVHRRMRRRKGSNGFSILPLEFPDFDAFARLNQIEFTAWELEVIEAIDDLYVAIKNEPRPD